MKKIIIVGGGGHTVSLLNIVKDCSLFEGYVDLKPNDEIGLKYLGNDDYVLEKYSPEFYSIHCAIVYQKNASLKLRKKILEMYSLYEMVNIFSSSSLISKYAELGCGISVLERAIINKARIGNNSIINTGSIIEHNVVVGENVFIGPGTIICGGVTIGNDVFIGAGVTIKDDVRICNDVIIGIGSNIVNNILEPGTYVGNPARRVK